MPKLLVLLNGGLGNQMFQYATARAISIDNNLELVLDDWSGFVRDFQYRRKYELSQFPISARTANAAERVPIWIYRAYRKARSNAREHDRRWFGNFLNETKMNYIPSINQVPISTSTWLTGYWQTPLYFLKHNQVICKELMPEEPKSYDFLRLADDLQSTESVALGLRLYEESTQPRAHARDGKVKTVSDIRKAIASVHEQVRNPRFFIFCTHRSPLIDQLNLPTDAVSVTHDDGFIGSAERLWLLSRCKHHLFTNSTYYWWGAWLSEHIRNDKSQLILAANNFINSDSIPEHWQTF
jgi:hypothetical protein